LGQDQEDVTYDQDKSNEDEIDCDLFLVHVQYTVVWKHLKLLPWDHTRMLAVIIRIPILISTFKAICLLSSEKLFLVSGCSQWLQPSLELIFLALDSLGLYASISEGKALFLIPSPLDVKVLSS
jgi:hypothetical protein